MQEWTIVASLKTYERHKSLACSPDGTYIAASGSGGYVIVLRLQRAATSGTATCGSRTSADNTATASSAGNSTQDQLVHVAAFACGADQIDCVRFGLFGGRPVLFVAAHCGSIYFLNIPGRVSSHTINKSTSTKQQQLLQGAQQQQSLSAKSPKAAATGTSAAAHFCVNGLPGAKLLPGRCRLGQDLLVQVSRYNLHTVNTIVAVMYATVIGLATQHMRCTQPRGALCAGSLQWLIYPHNS